MQIIRETNIVIVLSFPNEPVVCYNISFWRSIKLCYLTLYFTICTLQVVYLLIVKPVKSVTPKHLRIKQNWIFRMSDNEPCLMHVEKFHFHCWISLLMPAWVRLAPGNSHREENACIDKFNNYLFVGHWYLYLYFKRGVPLNYRS